MKMPRDRKVILSYRIMKTYGYWSGLHLSRCFRLLPYFRGSTFRRAHKDEIVWYIIGPTINAVKESYINLLPLVVAHRKKKLLTLVALRIDISNTCLPSKCHPELVLLRHHLITVTESASDDSNFINSSASFYTSESMYHQKILPSYVLCRRKLTEKNFQHSTGSNIFRGQSGSEK